jgi:hypothetical protein
MSPDMETVSSLSPDWILSPNSLQSDLQPKYEAVAGMEYAFLNLRSVQGMYRSIQELGEIFDRRDQAQQLYGRIPLYVGHYIFGGQGIAYFLAGFHAQYAFWGNTKQRLTGSTAGKYHDFVGVWDEMDNHGFRKNVPIERKGDQLKLKFDLMAHAEVGYEYNTQQAAKDYRVRPSDRIDCRLRFAGYIDFGILNICPETKKELYGVPEATIYDFPTYRMDHVFSTSDAARYWMRNLSVGIRFTVLFGFRPAERCILCDPWKH